MAFRERRVPLIGDGDTGRTREILTPEGIPIRFVLADAGSRVSAFITDIFVMIGLTLALAIPALILAIVANGLAAIVFALGLLAAFFIWNFYFIWFELNWQGRTPGKRWAHIRAIDAQGGPASADAVVARNLMRSVEFFMPFVALVSVAVGGSGWLVLGSLLWMFLFAFLPLLNRDRLRVGDLVAGTIVIRDPASDLLRDVAEAGTREAFEFTHEQLDVYGVYELQVLEQVLRGSSADLEVAAAAATVAAKIAAKIGWNGVLSQPEPFLRAFYAALRGRLEHKLLFGKRKEDKYDGPDRSA